MSYATNFLQAYGELCLIFDRTMLTMTGILGGQSSLISMKRSTRSARDVAIRDAAWEGMILKDSVVESGDYIQVGSSIFLTESVCPDPASGALSWFGIKTNVVISHCRLTENVDSDGNITTAWSIIADNLPAFAEAVTFALRQSDIGLLESTKYLVVLPRDVGVQLLDRLVMNGTPYKVDSVDDLSLSGVSRLQLGADLRP